MDVARPAPPRAPSLRPLLILAILGILIIASALAFAGSPASTPAPFGPARNGAILFSTADGDIAAVAPVTAYAADRPSRDRRTTARQFGAHATGSDAS